MLNKAQLQEELCKNRTLLSFLRGKTDPALKGCIVRQENKDGTARFYHASIDAESKKKIYTRIGVENAELYHSLNANRQYAQFAPDLQSNIELLEDLLAGYKEIDFAALLPAVPGAADLGRVQPSDGPFLWEDLKSSAVSPFRPEGLIYEADGSVFRSKGEAIHAMCFAEAEVEYIYEPEIRLGGIVLRPDFAVRNKRTGKIYFWEYFGMLDVEEYLASFSRKLPALMKLGIIPGYNLICTCEFKGVCTLSILDIQAKIRAYLL